MKFKAGLLAGCLLIAGCAKPLEVSSITEVKPVDPRAGVDVYAARRVAGHSVPEFAGEQLLPVRTYISKEGQGLTEVAGAQCSLKGPEFSAEAVTPAIVRVPLYREQSSALSITCSKEGYAPKTAMRQVFDVTRTQRLASGSGGGLLGFAVVAAWDAMADNSKNDWRYGEVAITFDDPGKVASSQ